MEPRHTGAHARERLHRHQRAADASPGRQPKHAHHHPLFLHYFGRVLAALGLDHPIENPFRLQTEGELLQACADGELLERLARDTISCSHPEAARWHRGRIGNCGSCYPCLIRRAAMNRVGWDRPSDYDVDALTDTDLLRRERVPGASLRAVLDALRCDPSPTDILLNGRIPDREAPAFHGVWHVVVGPLSLQTAQVVLREFVAAERDPPQRRRQVLDVVDRQDATMELMPDTLDAGHGKQLGHAAYGLLAFISRAVGFGQLR